MARKKSVKLKGSRVESGQINNTHPDNEVLSLWDNLSQELEQNPITCNAFAQV